MEALARSQLLPEHDRTTITMIALILILATNAACHRVTESFEDLPPEAFINTTTLYPVANKTSVEEKGDKKVITDANDWKPKEVTENADDDDKKEHKAGSYERNNTSDASKEFKPSPHLNTFVEASVEAAPTRPTFGDFRPLKKPPTGFLSSSKDQFKSSLLHKDVYKTSMFPYKIEENEYSKHKSSWRPFDQLDSRPTMQIPFKVPAGGMYRSPEAFKEKPSLAGEDEDFGLDFNDLKDNHTELKKRVNPWRSLLHLVTAFIPVGLIISALTPNIITVHSTEPENQYPNPEFRRSDLTPAHLAAISEPCRRRLLCELHADSTYSKNQNNGSRRRRPCHKIHCEDPEALQRTLNWLLTRHQK